MSVQRMLPFVLINILVSTLTVIAVWTLLDRRQPTACSQCGNTVELTPLDGVTSDVAGSQPELVLADEAAPTAIPDPPTPVPSGPPVHTVIAGEVLSSIAGQYGVSMQEIVDANGLEDVNSIFVGQQLVIPQEEPAVVAVAEEQAPEAIAETDAAVPTVEVVVGASTFEISSVSGVGDISAEQLLLVNVGPNTAFLEGWTLSNDAGSTYTFGDSALFGNGAGITVHTGSGENSPTDIFWGNSGPAWQSGQVIVLRDAEGNLQAEISVP